MKALVTGSDGFVGRHMCRALHYRGYEITRCDITQGCDCRDLFRTDTTRYDLVVHLAATVGGRASIDGRPLAVAQNLGLDAAMFEWAERTRPGTVLYFSSSAAYPVALQLPGSHGRLAERQADPQHPSLPDQTYGWAKLTGEYLASHARAGGVPVTVVRPFSGYGPGQPLDYPMAAFIDRGFRRTDPFEIWGDGTASRDWIHISDVVDGALELVALGVDGPVNLGTGRATTFNQLAGIVADQVGYEPQLEHDLSAPQGCWHRVADPTFLNYCYQPRVTLEQGVADLLRTAALAA